MRFRNMLKLALVLFILTTACKQKQSEKQTNNPDTLATNVVDKKNEGQNVPEWFRRVPQREGFVYAVGQASSKRPELARKKALLKAQTALAEKAGSVEKGVELKSVHVIKEHQVKQGARWQCYVLMEAPLQTKAN